MPDLLESRSRLLALAAAALILLLTAFTAWALVKNHTFATYPVHALGLLLAPALLSIAVGLFRPVRTGRALLLGLALMFAAWIVGYAGLAAAALLLFAALSVGDFVGRPGGIGRDHAGLLDALLALSLGLGVLAILLTALAHYKISAAPAYAAGLLALALAGWRRNIRYLGALGGWLSDDSRAGPGLWLTAGLFVGLALINISYSGLFGFTADTTSSHLYVSSYISTYGQWSFDVQKYVWGVEPLAADYLFGTVYLLSDASGAQFLNVLVTLLTAGLIYAASRPRAGTLNALLAATAWLAMPILLQLAQSLYAEGFLGLFAFACFVYLNDERMTESKPWWAGLVAGLLAGAAVAVKLTGWVFAPAYLLFVLLVLRPRHDWKWATRVAVTAALVMITLGGIQYWYALSYTGNPVFFYYNAVFHSPYGDPQNFFDSHWTGRYNWHLPFDLTFHTDRFGENGAGSMGFQWLVFLPAGLLLMFLKDGLRARCFGLTGLFYAAVVLMPEQYLRYALPAFPFLSVLLAEIGTQPVAALQVAYRAGLYAVIGVNVFAVQNMMHRFGDVPTGIVYHKDVRDEFLREVAPTVAANRIINALEPEPVNVLYVSMPGGAELRGTAYYQSWYNPLIASAFTRIHSPDDVGAIVAANEIRYIVLDPAFPHTRGILQVSMYCEHHAQLIAKIGTLSLYRVNPGATYVHDVVDNPDLADGAQGWKFLHGAVPRLLPGRGYLLARENTISQQLHVTNFTAGQPISFNASLKCLPPQGKLTVLIHWKTGPDEYKDSFAYYYCLHPGPRTVSEMFYAPPGTLSGVAELSVEEKTRVAVSQISVRD
ncbi:MAG: glycosyltransferase family 39 protein [Bacillota bacterium]